MGATKAWRQPRGPLEQAAHGVLAAWTKELEKARSKDNPDSARVANATLHLANLLNTFDRHEEELPLREQYLEACRRNLGLDDLDTVQAEMRLASCLVHLNRPDEADRLLQHVVKIRSAEQGAESTETVLAVALSANVARKLGRFDEARDLHLWTLAWLETQDSIESADIARMAMSTGHLLTEWREFEQASEFYRRAFEIRRRALGPDDPDTLISQRFLALTSYSSGQVDIARSVTEDVLERLQRTLGVDAVETAQVQVLLTNINRGHA
jgi:tetratricopeptide (TPR) repeat protein